MKAIAGSIIMLASPLYLWVGSTAQTDLFTLVCAIFAAINFFAGLIVIGTAEDKSNM